MRVCMDHPAVTNTRLDLCWVGLKPEGESRLAQKSPMAIPNKDDIVNELSLVCPGTHEHSHPGDALQESLLLTKSLAALIAAKCVKPEFKAA